MNNHIFYFHRYSDNNIYFASPLNNRITKIDFSLSKLNSTKASVMGSLDKSNFNPTVLVTIFSGQYKLLDTVEKISLDMNRIVRFSIDKDKYFVLTQKK